MTETVDSIVAERHKSQTMPRRVGSAILKNSGLRHLQNLMDYDGAAADAMKAMRDPTTAMVTAAVTAAERCGPGDYVAIYRAMIDAGLAETTA